MVLLEVDPIGVSCVEFESDAPRPVDMNSVAGRNESFQGVEIKPWKVHLLWRGRRIQSIKTDQDALVHLGIDLWRAALRPQLGQRLAPKCPDHQPM